MKLENYYLATIIVIIPSGKKHQWILKLLGENEEWDFTWSLSISSKDTYQLQRARQSNFTEKKSGRHYLNQGVKYH